MSILNRLRDALVVLDTTDEALYAVVAREIASGTLREGLWAKALAESQFDAEIAKAKYINLRVASLKQELADTERTQRERKRISARLHSAFKRRSYDECFAGWSQLAETGDPTAQYWLGVLHSTAGWSGRSLLLAYMWAKIAELNGHPDAGWLRYSFVPQMTSFDIDLAEKKANELTGLGNPALASYWPQPKK